MLKRRLKDPVRFNMSNFVPISTWLFGDCPKEKKDWLALPPSANGKLQTTSIAS